jgi:DNA primase
VENKEIIDILSGKLSEYIINHLKLDLKSNEFFKCPTGKHEDGIPSCHVNPRNTETWHCFGCNASGNIFHLAHFYEGLPINGMEFWTKNVAHLAKLFNIPYNPDDINEDLKEKYEMYRAYKDAASILCTYPENPESLIYQYLKERGWNKEIAQTLMIGCVENKDDFIAKMEALGWRKDYLMQIELMNGYILNKDNLIFVVCDDKGRPCGFAARDMKWFKGKTYSDGKPAPKYLNSRTSLIYQKGNILYNFYQAKTFTPPLWIFEGYADSVTAYEGKLFNACGIGSTNFTDNEDASHVELLKKYNVNDIILCLDNDSGGITGMNHTLEILCEYKNFNVRVCVIPEGHDDPDNYIRKFGIDAFLKLPLLKPFNYKLSLYKFDADKTKIVQEMVEYIATEKSPAEQSNMVSALSARTDFPIEIIDREVRNLTSQQDFQKHMEFKELQEQIDKDIKRAKNLSDLAQRVTRRKNELDEKIDAEDFSRNDMESYHIRITELKEEIAADVDPGFNCGKYQELSRNLEGIPKKASMIGLAGISNIGKTSFMRSLTLELAKKNEDILVIVMSIDDPFQKVIPGYLSLLTGLSISDIRRARKRIWNNPGKMELWKEGWRQFNALSENLVVRDIEDGSTTVALEKCIKYYKQRLPNKKLFCVVDNFHKLRDFPDLSERSKYTAISGRIKDLTTIYNIPILNVLELRKFMQSVNRPTIQDIKDTIDIEYDCDVIWLMHQELHINPSTDDVWVGRTDYDNKDMPINELQYAKNKESGWKGIQRFRFRTDHSEFYEISEEEYNNIKGQHRFYNDPPPMDLVKRPGPKPELTSLFKNCQQIAQAEPPNNLKNFSF